MQNRITYQINSTHTTSLKSNLKTIVAGFANDFKNALSYEAAIAANTLYYFGTSQPLNEMISFVGANIAGSQDSAELIARTASDDIIDQGIAYAFTQLLNNIQIIYSQVPNDLRKTKCASSFISRVDTLTYNYQTIILNTVNNIVAQVVSSTSSDRSSMTATISSFHLKIYYCSLKPLDDCKTCMIDLV